MRYIAAKCSRQGTIAAGEHKGIGVVAGDADSKYVHMWADVNHCNRSIGQSQGGSTAKSCLGSCNYCTSQWLLQSSSVLLTDLAAMLQSSHGHLQANASVLRNS